MPNSLSSDEISHVAKDTTDTTASNTPVSSQSTITIAPQEPLPLIFPPLPVYLISSSTHSDDWTHPLTSPPPSFTTRPSSTGTTPEQTSILSQRHSPAEKLREQRIGTGTTVILLGDSVIQGIDLSRSTEPHEVGQKTCVPEVTVADLIA